MGRLFLWALIGLPLISAAPTEQTFQNGSSTVPTPRDLHQLLSDLDLLDLEDEPLHPPTRAKREACEVSNEVLNELVESVRSLQTESSVNALPLSTAANSGSGCIDTESKMKIEVNRLKRLQLKLVMNGTSLSETEYNELKMMYAIIREAIVRYVNDIQSPKNSMAKEELLKAIQEKLSFSGDLEFNVTIGQETTMKEVIKDNMINVIVSEIYAKNVENASKRFVELGNPGLIYEIVEKMSADPQQDLLLAFISELPWILHRMLGFRAMLDKGNLDYAIFTLEYAYKSLIKIDNKPQVIAEIQHDIDYVAEKLAPQVEAKVAAVVDEIIASTGKSDYIRLIVYAKIRSTPFNVHLEEIVEKIYKKTGVNAIEKIMMFSNDLITILQSARVYVKLYKLLEANNNATLPIALRIAYKVKELLEMSNYQTTDDKVKEDVNQFKIKLADAVRSIIFGQVCIKSQDLDGYIQIDSSTSNAVVLGANKDIWEFETVDDGVSFQIKHVDTSRYFFANVEHAFTKRQNSNEEKHRWSLTESSLKSGRLFIKNDLGNGYLYAEIRPQREAHTIPPQLEEAMKAHESVMGAFRSFLSKSMNRLHKIIIKNKQEDGYTGVWKLIDSENCG